MKKIFQKKLKRELMGVNLLGKIKIHELAKEIGLTSKEIIEKALKLGIEAKSHMSVVEDSDVEKIKKSLLDRKSVV